MAEVEKLKNTLKELKSEIAVKKAEVEGLEEGKRILTASIESEIVKAKEEADKIIGKAKKLANEIVSEAESKKKKALHEAEQLKKERDKLEAEKALLEKAIKIKLEELRTHPEKETTYTRPETPSSPMDSLLARIPSSLA